MAESDAHRRELTTLGAIPATRDGVTTWWFQDPPPDLGARLATRDLDVTRRLHQMRVDLPLNEPEPATTRDFRPGHDDEAFLAVNNRAFHWHPEQGNWSEADLRAAMAQDWFDPQGCRILDLDDTGSVDGFCWMKPHDSNPPMGEIYVIALDPKCQGRGLGAPLAAAGLDWIWRHHDVSLGMLYVEADNDAAVALYRSMGFVIDHTDLGVVGPHP